MPFLTIRHEHSFDEETVGRLHHFLHALGINMEILMASMDDLKAAVTRQTDVEQGVVSLLQGLSSQLKDAKASNDPAAIQSVIDQLDANTKTLSDAVAANTPSA